MNGCVTMETLVDQFKVEPLFNIDYYCLKSMDLFNNLSDKELCFLVQESSKGRFRRGSVVYYEGRKHSGMYCIQKGVVKVFKIGFTGKEYILRFAHKGDVIAYRSLLTNEKACTSAKVMEDAVLRYIPFDVITRLFDNNWKFRQKIIKMMCKELGESNAFVTEIAQKSIRERTAEMLLYLHDEFGEDCENMLNIRITRDDMANKLGSATESVIRVLTSFKNEKLISLHGRQIRILNRNKLHQIAFFQMYRHHYKF